jgi:large conductance mechanosensitive channel
MALATFALTKALVENLVTPIIGEPDFADLHFTINESVFKYGAFINALIVFLGTVAAVYSFVVVPYKHYQELKGASAKTRPCAECTTAISIAARRCPSCTAVVIPEGV